jgi:hypothetical protein
MELMFPLLHIYRKVQDNCFFMINVKLQEQRLQTMGRPLLSGRIHDSYVGMK